MACNFYLISCLVACKWHMPFFLQASTPWTATACEQDPLVFKIFYQQSHCITIPSTESMTFPMLLKQIIGSHPTTNSKWVTPLFFLSEPYYIYPITNSKSVSFSSNVSLPFIPWPTGSVWDFQFLSTLVSLHFTSCWIACEWYIHLSFISFHGQQPTACERHHSTLLPAA